MLCCTHDSWVTILFSMSSHSSVHPDTCSTNRLLHFILCSSARFLVPTMSSDHLYLLLNAHVMPKLIKSSGCCCHLMTPLTNTIFSFHMPVCNAFSDFPSYINETTCQTETNFFRLQNGCLFYRYRTDWQLWYHYVFNIV